MTKPRALKTVTAIFLLCAAMAIDSPAQTFTTLHSFDISDGAQPYAGLARDAAGNLYGTLAYGGRNGLGSVYKLIPRKSGSGPEWATEKILLNFSGQDGIYPFGGLILDTAGNLYGTTYYGGYLSDCDYSGCGVIFELTP